MPKQQLIAVLQLDNCPNRDGRATAVPKTVELEGHSLALARLTRMGYICSLTPSNAPFVDIQGFHFETKKPILVQVKTISEERSLDWQLSAERFLNVHKSEQPDGRIHMQVRGRLPLSNQTIYWVFILLTENHCDNCRNYLDRYYICTLKDVQDIAERKFTADMAKKNGYRKGGSGSTHFRVEESDLKNFTDWTMLT